MPGSAAERAVTVSLVSGALLLAAFAIVAAMRDWMRATPPKTGSIGRRVLQTIGLILFGAALLAIPGFIAATIGTAILAAGAPLTALLPLILAGVVGLWLAQRSSDHGMEGCTRLIAMLVSAYVAVWGLTALAMTWRGGPHSLPLALLRPFLAALPIALLLGLVTRSGTKLRSGALALVFVATWAAICFTTVELGLWGGLLPAGIWPRYALAGAIGVAPLACLPLVGLRNRRSKQDWRGPVAFAVMLAILGMITGLVWAAAGVLLAE
ncbi:hypothetical protein FHS95_001217 [Sphingomonas naasensis]|uniref:Uncharacterized protein n=1 Tax=Sphingomonas naasensis TaxID=1344951 RepID=A0A4S1WCW3_9SPHN|nr:hypothetical protein [Sphingomonas naasensis]NIJ19548.1 hypothetical protein [Sphingomonas naasensis]TGX39280.1 hypothetical protein E5A74_17345 [Sphingomonas naasensis]